MPSEEKVSSTPPTEEIDFEILEDTGDQSQGDGKQRERSSIQFPYQDLDEAVAIAKGVHEFGGTACQLNQLAGQVKQSPTSSMFKLRVSTARIFGFVTNAHGNVTLTPLGVRVCDPQQEQAAKVEAFLNVPLYKQVYEQFKNASLPPNNGLEATMVSFGVAVKQKSNARQVFHRSATQAGFFAFGPNRLVPPAIKSGSPAAPGAADPGQSDPKKQNGNSGSGDGGGGRTIDPAINGLIQRLPAADSDWPLEKQAKWLLAVSHAFDVIYPRQDDDRSLKIEIVKV
ncbi:MAG: hypothetical protein M3N93_07105 [Acidobacteriota bacterium]|nr:hypothetical protein [Acidobacteriota bacterium]